MNALMYEDWILAPSMVAWMDGTLDEGKSIGTYAQQDLKLHGDVVQSMIDPAALNKLRHKGARQGRKAMDAVRERTEARVLKLIEGFQSDILTAPEFKASVTQVMRAAWYESFKAGVRAGGVPSKKIGGYTAPKLSEGDDKWFRSAMTHEMRYLNRFVRAVVENEYKMPLPQRVKMYVNSLNSFYESSRVIALPDTTLIYWTGPSDKVTCESCRYLFENSPFTKLNLPTVPRAGLSRCLCLTDCRVDIVSKRGTIKFEDVRVGDMVLDAHGQWADVYAVHHNQSDDDHRYAVIVGEHGLFGVTDDHEVFTENGWVNAKVAATQGLRVRRVVGSAERDGSMQLVFDQASVEEGATTQAYQGGGEAASHQVRRPDDRVVQHDEDRREEVREVLGGRQDQVRLPLSMGVGTTQRTHPRPRTDTPRGRRLYQRLNRESQTLYTRGTRGVSRHRSVLEGCGTQGRVKCELVRGSSYTPMPTMRRRLSGNEITRRRLQPWALLQQVLRQQVSDSRQVTEMQTMRQDVCCETSGDRQRRGKVLLSELLRKETERGNQDPAVLSLREDVRASRVRDQEVEVGQVLLLQSVLDRASPLYDLTTSSGSFVANGMAIHNSNCRDKLLIRIATAEQVTEATENAPARSTHVSKLYKIKRGE